MPTFWGREWLVNTTTAGSQQAPTVAVLSNGNSVVTWLDAEFIRAQMFNGFGNPIGSEIEVGAHTGARPDVVALPDGGFAVGLIDGTALKIVRYDANGVASAPITVANDLQSGLFLAFSLGQLPDGSIAVVYTRLVASESDVALRIVSPTGSVSGQIAVDTAAGAEQSSPSLAVSSSRIITVWYDSAANSGDVQARTFNLSGASGSTEISLTPTTGSQLFSAAAALGNGFVVAFTDEATGTIFAQRLTGGGSVTGAPVAVGRGSGSFVGPVVSVAALPNDGYFVVWRAFDGRIYGRGYDGMDSPVGNTILIALGNATVPDVAAMPDGRVIVTWNETRGAASLDPTGSGIYTRIIDPRDGVVNGTNAANTLYGHQYFTDQISGFGGNDTIFALGGDDLVFGGDGNDLVFGWTGRDVLWGDFGNDTLHGEQDDDVLLGVDGDDLAFGGAGNDTLYGWFGADTLWGGDGNDLILGEQDNDLILGEAGNDQLDGNDGADTLYGFLGNDTLLGGAGGDLIFGEQDNDLAFGFTGNDTIFGGDGNDTLFGEQDNDILLGELGNDELNGQEGDDTLYGFDGDDRLFGFSGNDQLFGENGNDVMLGEDGNDFLGGLAGNDFMVGGRGADTLWGDGGDDTYVFALADLQNGVNDEINSFAEIAGNFDRIRFEGVAASAVSFGQVGGNAIISIAIPGGTATIIVTSFNAAALADQLIYV